MSTVSVVVPFYNEEELLENCIKSIRDQTYEKFECVLVNNCSTDASQRIAQEACRGDPRFTLVDNAQFLTQLQNLNRAFRAVSADAKYVKMVLADDSIYPRCIEEMVLRADEDDDIVVVGAYTLLDWGDHSKVYLDGLPAATTVIAGTEVCRRLLLDGLYVFGSPTATLIRADVVRQRARFYDEASVTCDVDVFFEILPTKKLGFVHQVLSSTTRHNESLMSKNKHFDLMALTLLTALQRYGQQVLTEPEYARRKRALTRNYYRQLGRAVLFGKPEGYWGFQKNALAACGRRLEYARVVRGVLTEAAHRVLNPGETLAALIRRTRR